MKKDELFKVLNDIDDKYIEEAGLPEKKRSVWKLLVPVMAVLIAAVMIPLIKPAVSDVPQDVIAVPETVEPEVKEEEPGVIGKGVTVRAFVPPTAPTGLSDMIGFVMVGDNGYLQVIQQMDIPLEKGELIGTANACIGEWEIRETEEGELVSNMEGTVYEAAGYDPDFRVVFVCASGGEWLMEREGGYTLYTGKDIFEDRLHVGEYLSSIYV